MMEMGFKGIFTVWNIWKKTAQIRAQISRVLSFLQQVQTTSFNLLQSFK